MEVTPEAKAEAEKNAAELIRELYGEAATAIVAKTVKGEGESKGGGSESKPSSKKKKKVSKGSNKNKSKKGKRR